MVEVASGFLHRTYNGGALQEGKRGRFFSANMAETEEVVILLGGHDGRN